MNKYVIWKADGTLFSEEAGNFLKTGDISTVVNEQVQLAYQEIKRKYPNIETPAFEAIEELAKAGKPINTRFEIWTPNHSEELFEAYRRQDSLRKLASFKAVPHVKETITALNKKGVINLVIGFRSLEMTKLILEKLRFPNPVIADHNIEEDAKFIERSHGDVSLYIIPTQPSGLRLPNPDIWDQLIVPNFNSINKNNVMLIGKESAELGFARQLDISSVWGSFSDADVSVCIKTKPTYQVESSEDFLGIIEKHLGLQDKKENNFQTRPTMC